MSYKSILIRSFILLSIIFGSFQIQNAALANEDKPEFLILRPDTDHPFWVLFEQAMRDACDDLGCAVQVQLADWDHFKMIGYAKELATAENKPDMVFFQSFKSNGPEIIKALELAQVNGFLINAGLTEEQAQDMGKPREKYKYWIGQMMPDDFGAGQSTAEALYHLAKEKGFVKDGKVYFAGIEGNSADGASIERLRGLNTVAEKYDDLEVLQVVQGKWETDTSKKMTLALKRRYPELRVVWAAGDPIAFGVIDGASEMNLKAGEDILTAGVDWAPRALDEIENGRMAGSAGGHFMEGAWAAIAAYDYLKGHDFKDHEGVEMKSQMGFLNKENLALYKDRFGDSTFGSIDFTKLSRAYNGENHSYDFNILNILEDK